jgi:hypothetical protein
MDENKQYECINGELVELSADGVAAPMAMKADAAPRVQDNLLHASRRRRNALLSHPIDHSCRIQYCHRAS